MVTSSSGPGWGAPEFGTNFAAEFNLSITEALRDQLSAAIAERDPAPLTESNIEKIEPRPGVYQLYLDGELVYVGKASSQKDAGLRKRLMLHHDKLAGRKDRLTGESPLSKMTFCCLYVPVDLDAVAPEKMLISSSESDDAAAVTKWNGNGFGNNDPGSERDSTTLSPDHFDWRFPIDLSTQVTIEPPLTKRGAPKKWTLGQLLSKLHTELPFRFRVGKSYPKALEITGTLGAPTTMKAEEWITFFAQYLPKGWKVCVLPGRVIAYPSGKLKSGNRSISTEWTVHENGKLVRKVLTPESDRDSVITDSENVEKF